MTDINLLPWRKTRARANTQRLFYFLLLGLLLDVFIVVLIHQYLGQCIQQQHADKQRLQQEIAVLDRQIGDIGKTKEAMARLVLRAQKIHQLMKERLLLLHCFDRLVGLLPSGLSLHRLRRREASITLEGEALSHSRLSLLMHHLEREKWLHQPFISDIQKRRISPSLMAYQFKLSFGL